VVAIVAIYQGRETGRQRRAAERERNVAVSRVLAFESANTVDADPELGLALAMWAFDTSPTDQADVALRNAALAFRQRAALPADPLTAEAAAYNPQGTRVVTGGDGGIARVWDVATRRSLATLDARHGGVFAARYSPSGQSIALGFADGTLLVTDGSLAGAKQLLRRGPKVESVVFSRDGNRIAAALDDGTVRVVAPDGSADPVILRGPHGPVLGADIDAAGRRVVAAGKDGSVRIWNVADGGVGRIIHTGATSEADVAFSPNGSLVLGAGYDGKVRLWDPATGAETRSQQVSSRALTAVAFSADGRRYVVGGRDGVIRVWSIVGGPPVAILRGQRSRVYDVRFGRTNDRVVSAGDDGTARIWDAGRTVAWVVSSSPTDSIDLSPSGRVMVTASDDGTLRLWDAASGRLRRTVPGVAGYTAARFSPAADEVVVDRYVPAKVLVWPLSQPAPTPVAMLPKGAGPSVARFDSAGRRIVYANLERRLIVRDLRSGREVALGRAPTNIYDAQVSPDGKAVAVVSESGPVRIWRLDRPAAPVRTLVGHRGHVNALAYSRDGRIVTAGADRTARVWSPNGAAQLVLRGHRDEVTAVAFTPDGAHVLSSSSDGTLRLWDAARGDLLAVLQSGSPVYDIAVDRHGRIATLDGHEVVRIFDCEVCGSSADVRALARARAPRQLTAEQKRQFLAAAR
jgi:WD40 repeat protein